MLWAGGFWESSIAQKGIDQMKSADVVTYVRPGMPSKIGGWALKFKYQEGWIGPSGPRDSGRSLRRSRSLPVRSKLARP